MVRLRFSINPERVQRVEGLNMQIHPTALVSKKARLADDIQVGPYVVIGDNVTIGSKTKIGAYCLIEGNTSIGSGCEIFT